MPHIPGARTMRRLAQRAVTRPLADLARRRRYAAKIAADARAITDYAPERLEVVPAREPAEASLSGAQWRALRSAVSERGRHFFSDNLVSNEGSYVDAAERLCCLPRGLAYVGVGPEQIFSHLAWLEPRLAFVVDVRPDNGLLHQLYQALFAEARDRIEWLGLLLGRPVDDVTRLPNDAPAGALLAHIERVTPSDQAFEHAQRRLLGRVEALGGSLSLSRRRALRYRHHRFFVEQLGLRFRLRGPSPGEHPSLGRLLAERGPGGLGGFLGREVSYQRVRRLQCELRVVPVVGDLAGDHALARIADELRQRQLPVGAIYVSNAEQYLFENDTWRRWIGNLVRLPHTADSLVVRAYLDQGRPHPRQRPGHRTTTLTQPIAELIVGARQQRFETFWQLVNAPSPVKPGAGGYSTKNGM